MLARTPYAPAGQPGQTLAAAQRAVAECLLWDLRVLAGWLPRQGVGLLRALACWFEIANVDELLQSLAGRPAGGAVPARIAGDGLAPAAARAQPRRAAGQRWRPRPGVTRTVTPGVTSGSACGCAGRCGSRRPAIRPGPGRQAQWRCCWPGSGSPPPGCLLPLATAAQARSAPRPAAPLWLARGPCSARPRQTAGTLSALGDALPGQARWVLAGVSSPDGLWRAEAAWWARVGADGRALLRASGPDSGPVLGAVAVLAADGRRVCAALEAAARGGAALETYDAVA